MILLVQPVGLSGRQAHAMRVVSELGRRLRQEVGAQMPTRNPNYDPSKPEACAQRRSAGVSDSSSLGSRVVSVATIGTAFSNAFLSVMTVIPLL